jgi:hypothetical protein
MNFFAGQSFFGNSFFRKLRWLTKRVLRPPMGTCRQAVGCCVPAPVPSPMRQGGTGVRTVMRAGCVVNRCGGVCQTVWQRAEGVAR